MTEKEAIKNLKEIIQLSKEEIENNDENTTAILDITDLKSLAIVLKALEQRIINQKIYAEEYEKVTKQLNCEVKDNLEKAIALEQKDNEISSLNQVHNYDVKTIDEVKGEAVKLYTELKEKDRQIKIKDGYNKLLVDIGFDYDGCETVESLKSVIDDLVDLSKRAIANDDTYGIYEHGNRGTLNILFEEVSK